MADMKEPKVYKWFLPSFHSVTIKDENNQKTSTNL